MASDDWNLRVPFFIKPHGKFQVRLLLCLSILFLYAQNHNFVVMARLQEQHPFRQLDHLACPGLLVRRMGGFVCCPIHRGLIRRFVQRLLARRRRTIDPFAGSVGRCGDSGKLRSRGEDVRTGDTVDTDNDVVVVGIVVGIACNLRLLAFCVCCWIS